MKIKILLLVTVLSAVLAWPDESITFQYGVAPTDRYLKCVDTYVSQEKANMPFGVYPHLIVSGTSGKLALPMIRFDLENHIPPAVIIKKAVLHLYVEKSKGSATSLRWRSLASKWKENQTSWTVSASGVAWKTPGGDMMLTQQSGSISMGTDAHTWDVTSMVQAAAKHPLTNFGFILEPGHQDGGFEASYFSTESDDVTKFPKLVVTYITEKEAAAVKEAKLAEIKKIRAAQAVVKKAKKFEAKKKALARTPKPSGFKTVPLVSVPYKSWNEVKDVPRWVNWQKFNQLSGTGLETDKAPKSIISKYGYAYYFQNLSCGEVKTKRLESRIKQMGYIHLDNNGDGIFGKDEQYRFKRGVAGPFVAAGIHSRSARSKVRYDYTMFVYAGPGSNESYFMRHGAYLKGDFNGSEIRVWDENDNGKFDDYGYDMISVGGKAQFLNKYTQIKGKWYELHMPPTGEFIGFKTKTKIPTVAVDFFRAFDGGKYKFMPDYVMFTKTATGNNSKGADGSYIATARQKMIAVPEGVYTITYAQLSSSRKKEKLFARGDAGYMPTIDLKGKKMVRLKWGAPFILQATVRRKGPKFMVDGKSIKLKGAAGETYLVSSGKLLMTPPNVELYTNDKREVSRRMQPDGTGGNYLNIDVQAKTSGKYDLKIVGRSPIFGPIEGIQKVEDIKKAWGKP